MQLDRSVPIDQAHELSMWLRAEVLKDLDDLQTRVAAWQPQPMPEDWHPCN